MPKVTIDEIQEICVQGLPFVQAMGLRIEELANGRVRVRLPFSGDLVRPGGTISGPAMMGLADFSVYAAVLSIIGPLEKAATTSLTCNFLRKPGRCDLVAEARILKSGKRLAFGDVEITSVAEEHLGPVAHVTATYSLPPGYRPEN